MVPIKILLQQGQIILEQRIDLQFTVWGWALLLLTELGLKGLLDLNQPVKGSTPRFEILNTNQNILTL